MTSMLNWRDTQARLDLTGWDNRARGRLARQALSYRHRRLICMDIVLIIVASVVFIAGVAAGAVLILVAHAIRREEREFSLIGRAPDPAVRGARVILGVRTARDRASKDLQRDSWLNNAWQSTNSEIGDSYRLMGPPPSDEISGIENEQPESR
jgi:hypothetical protein